MCSIFFLMIFLTGEFPPPSQDLNFSTLEEMFLKQTKFSSVSLFKESKPLALSMRCDSWKSEVKFFSEEKETLVNVLNDI